MSRYKITMIVESSRNLKSFKQEAYFVANYLTDLEKLVDLNVEKHKNV